MGIEYSLSCPQGGDGTEGDIVSQNAALTAKIIDWILQVGSPDVPKLFKLTAAVTSIVPILRAIHKVFEKYPTSKAGVTLANSFPTLAFRPLQRKGRWEEGVIVGMSGEGVTPISNLTLAQAVPEGIEISGNGGPMNYKAAMDFLALGVKTVQFCTIAMKHGYGIIHELESGTSFLMQERGIKSMKELIGIAQPHPITDFMAFSPVKKLSEANDDLCVSCGNCARCPYLAIELDERAASPHGPGPLHRLLDLCAEMLHRRHTDARPHARKNSPRWSRTNPKATRSLAATFACFAITRKEAYMTTRFENGIVVTLGPKNQVLWNSSVVTDGENIVAVGDAAEMKTRYPERRGGGLHRQDHPARLHLHAPSLLFHHGTRHGHPRRTRLQLRGDPRTPVVESGPGPVR